MRIVFLGEDSFSQIVVASIIEAGYEVVLVASPKYDNLKHLKLEKYIHDKNIEYCRVEDINSKEFYKKLRDIEPDLIVTAHFERLLKTHVINLPKIGCINLHPSILPFYRGMAPQHWPIINGEEKTGVTVHFIDLGIDTGDIIVRKEIQLTEDLYVFDLQLKMREVYKTIVVEAIEILKKDGPYIKQTSFSGSYYGKLKKAQTIIDNNMRSIDAIRLIRGVSRPYMGASYKDYIIWKAHTSNGHKFSNLGIIKKKDKTYLVLKDGVLELTDFEKIKI